METTPPKYENRDMPYSNRELDEKFTDIQGSLGRIEAQTTKTNGRVTMTEKQIYVGMGGLAVLTALIVPVLGWALYQIVTLPNSIHVQVQAAILDALHNTPVN